MNEEDPEGLSTYVNYPSTEYLELPFLDIAAFNVFLEDEQTFEAYLARLQNLAGDRPLLITEVGVDSQRNGEEGQARALAWQVRHAFGTGAAGVFVFSWTDEWHRGGHEVLNWDFGLVDRERRPKPSLGVVREAFAEVPFPSSGPWPRISVVVCTHNGERTLSECLERLRDLCYPNYETIVVNDGSTDGSGDLARSYGVKVVETPHRGLSFARNAGIDAATGEIVAFLDDDAYPDHDWLHYVAASLREGSNAGIGGPNIPPPDDSLVAECVAAAPGAPIHVLISDREAEHLPGCNMAFRTAALRGVGGFDERFIVWKQRPLVADDFQLDPVRQARLPRELRGANRLVRGITPSRIRQDRSPIRVDVIKQGFARPIRNIHPPDRNRHHVGAGSCDRLGHHCVGRVLAAADD